MAWNVAIARCSEYDDIQAKQALEEVLAPIGGLDWVKPGMRVAIKTNLVAPMRPEATATTHPVLLKALANELIQRGASVVIGDSPGGLYTGVYLNGVYAATGLNTLTACGAQLNQDFSEREVEYPQGTAIRRFMVTDYLLKADAVINFCKLKSHGMMGMSAAVKNLFGMIPGTLKPEYHYRFPDEAKFADMLIDLNEFLKPQLHLVDAVMAMEGNGPTAGKPRHVGALMASTNQYALDMLCAQLIGQDRAHVPTLEAAVRRGLGPESFDELTVHGDWKSLAVSDFDNIMNLNGIHFENRRGGPLGKLVGKIVTVALRSKPQVENSCIGCGVCNNICPAHAIQMQQKPEGKRPVIDRKACIHCFCCQEFCPKGAMVVKRPIAAKILHPHANRK